MNHPSIMVSNQMEQTISTQSVNYVEQYNFTLLFPMLPSTILTFTVNKKKNLAMW